MIIKKIWQGIKDGYEGFINLVILKYRGVRREENVKIHGIIKIYGHGTIKIGKNTIINSSMDANPIGGDSRTIFSLKSDAELSIGEDSGISNTAIVCHSRVTIGSRVRIGGGTKIYDTDFHSLSFEERMDYATETVNTKPVSIEDDAFVGAHCIILKGVRIGQRSIVGAGSVVTKEIPDDEVWAGNPARFIRRL
ncbi:MAG: acyltransferase [Lachnospiraceae bacterium]|jgi:acetyltransferase-like isoleucine patch superfamily enzyme|nr:acyltransferase [Lachnospiraceae bacterium]